MIVSAIDNFELLDYIYIHGREAWYKDNPIRDDDYPDWSDIMQYLANEPGIEYMSDTGGFKCEESFISMIVLRHTDTYNKEFPGPGWHRGWINDANKS